jgi:DNA-binding PadR family transcriptional regulator
MSAPEVVEGRTSREAAASPCPPTARPSEHRRRPPFPTLKPSALYIRRRRISLTDATQPTPMTDESKLNDLLPLTPTVFHVLVALASGPRHGYGVAQEVEELTEGRIIMGPGTLYGSLRRMLRSGLITEAENPGEEDLHAERRLYYRMTPVGSAALQAESTRLMRTASLAQERLGV